METSFCEEVATTSSKRWRGKLKNIFGSERLKHVALGELFFWSSPDTKGLTPRMKPHLAFCTKLNKDAIDHYKPKAIIFTAVSHSSIKLVQQLFGVELNQWRKVKNARGQNETIYVRGHDVKN